MPGTTLSLRLPEGCYDIILERGCLSRAGELLNLRRRVLIVTDSGVPEIYAKTLADQCPEARVVRLPEGEETKDLDSFRLLLRSMLDFGMGRGDCVAAVGGGVVGDLAGFAAACYMRGIDFYNLPTTVLSQVDSSVGGKTAVDLDGVKNVVGAFHQPRRVLIDPSVLATLPPRQISNGLAEAVKMALCFDEDGFALFEALEPEKEFAALSAGKPAPLTERLILNALETKKRVVEEDEKERGLRRVLNFGHTLGHGIESLQGKNGLLHGECVALGMLPLCAPAVRDRLLPVLKKLSLPTACPAEADRVMQAVIHDKKMYAGRIRTILVEKAGSFTEREMTPGELRDRYVNQYGEGRK